MMSLRLIAASFLTATLFTLSSCNETETKTDTATTGSDSVNTTATTEAVAPSTIVTTPQPMFLVRHKVGNFGKFKTTYDAHDSLRVGGGMHSYVIGRGMEGSNMVFVAVKTDDIAKAKAFAANPKLKEAMQKSGIIGKPIFKFVTITFQDTAVISSSIRSMTNFMVKDWDAWEKAFKEGKQERIDNGIIERAYGHDADDNKNVTLVTAITDTAKASAYWKSDMLKKEGRHQELLGYRNDLYSGLYNGTSSGVLIKDEANNLIFFIEAYIRKLILNKLNDADIWIVA